MKRTPLKTKTPLKSSTPLRRSAPIKAAGGKPKKCAVRTCRKSFVPKSSHETWCSAECREVLALAHLRKQQESRAKAERKQHREAKQRLKTKGDHLREAQAAFNAYIRERDRVAGHPCISSGKPLDWSANAVDAGHYRSRGSAPHLRFDERNCHAQSKQENRFLSGNVVDYRINLIKRIGLEAVEALESDQSERHYTIEDLKAVKAKYREKTRELKRANDKTTAGESA